MAKKRKPRATRIVWDREVHGPDERVSMAPVIRRSPNYLELARYFLDNPPKGKNGAFRPRELPGSLATQLQTYRKDVEDWVAMQMCTAIYEDGQHGDGALFSQVLRQLHNKSWDGGVMEKGFYLVQPVPRGGMQVGQKETTWALQAVGKKKLPHVMVKGVGWWKEPSPEEFESWQTRIAFIHLRSMANKCTEAAITGRSIGNLPPERLLRLVESATLTARMALPPSEDERKRKAKKRKK